MSVLGLWKEELQAFWEGVNPKVVHELFLGKEGHLVLRGGWKNPPIRRLREGRFYLVDPRNYSLEEVPHARMHPRMTLNKD